MEKITDEEYEFARYLITGEFDDNNIDDGFTSDEVKQLVYIIRDLQDNGTIDVVDICESNDVNDYLTNLIATYKNKNKVK